MKDQAEIYEERLQKFIMKIKVWETKQVNRINQVSKDQTEYESQKIIGSQKQKIDNQFRIENKNTQNQIKIQKSRKINQLRLSKMKIRNDMIEKIKRNSSQNLLTAICQTQVYEKLLIDLILQGLIRMLQQKIVVKCLKRDKQIVQIAKDYAVQKYMQLSGLKVQATVSEEPIKSDQLGGIILCNANGKIVCRNTLKARLDYAIERNLPQISKQLFS